MNTMRLIQVTLVVTVLFLASIARGQTLPASLPIGSKQKMLDSAVTNQHMSVYMFLGFKESPEQIRDYGCMNSTFTTVFPNYQSFLDYIHTNGMALKRCVESMSATDRPTANAIATLYISTKHSQPPKGSDFDTDSNRTTWYKTKPLGLFWNITEQSFVESMEPDGFRSVMLGATNLQRFCIEVQCTNVVYTNQWTSTSKSWSNSSGLYPAEEIVKNAIFFNSWYGTGDYRVRIKFDTGATVFNYTQTGSVITAPVVRMLDKNNLRVTVSPGSDTTVEMTSNFITWQRVGILDGQSGLSSVVLTTSSSAPNRFFRAFSN